MTSWIENEKNRCKAGMALHEYYSQQNWENVWFTFFLPPSLPFFILFFPLNLKAVSLTCQLRLCPVFVCCINFVFPEENQVFRPHTSTNLSKELLWGKKNPTTRQCSPSIILNYVQFPWSPKTKYVHYQPAKTLPGEGESWKLKSIVEFSSALLG